MCALYTCAHECLLVFTSVYLWFHVYKTVNTVYDFVYLCIHMQTCAYPSILVYARSLGYRKCRYPCVPFLRPCILVYASVYMFIRVYILVNSGVHIGTCVYPRILVHTCLNIYTRRHPFNPVCTYVYLCINVNTLLYMCILFMRLYLFIHTLVYTWFYSCIVV